MHSRVFALPYRGSKPSDMRWNSMDVGTHIVKP
jgi:hypothetical protein